MRVFYFLRKWFSQMRVLVTRRGRKFEEKEAPMPCNYKLLVAHPHAFIRYCSNCQRYRIGFYTLHIELNAENYRIFQKYVARETADLTEADLIVNCRNIILETPAQGYKIWLTPSEIQELSQYLEDADTEKTVQDMLELFNTESRS